MAWSDFFNNMREALHKAEQEQKTPAQSGASTSLNDILRPNIQRPEITYGAHSAERNTPKKKTYQQVWGFEQDKANYGNERNGDNLNWRSLAVLNNDTGDQVKFDVGYDTDGRISGVRDYKPDGTTMGYYGKDLVSNFFMNNFDRDATDYTIFEEDPASDDNGSQVVLFNSANDGAFIPSDALNWGRNGVKVPRQSVDKPYSLEDILNNYERQINTGYKDFRFLLNDKQSAPYRAALNGTLEPVENAYPRTEEGWRVLEANLENFKRDIEEIRNTDDASKRLLKLDAARFNYSNIPAFVDILDRAYYVEAPYEREPSEESTLNKEKLYDDCEKRIDNIIRFRYPNA